VISSSPSNPSRAAERIAVPQPTEPHAREEQRHRVRRWSHARGMVRYLSVAAIIVGWQVVCSTGRWSASLVPSPAEILAATTQWAADGRLLSDIASSLFRVTAGSAIAALTALVLALLLALAPALRAQSLPIVELLRPVPPIAWIPLAILWFGLGDSSAIFLVFLGAFFPIFTNALAGLLSVRMTHVNTSRCLGASRWMLVWDVMLPAATPAIFVGLRTGIGVGWMSLIAAELVGAQSGLGYVIQTSRILLSIEQVVAGMLMVGLLGFFINLMITAVGARVTAWHRDALGADPGDDA
jgi:ABC-type nitrate/sulfonate/bicarbonate transport system permease component